MQNAIINVNGQIFGREEAKVSIFDRSYLYGDSLYEVVRSYHGKFFLIDEHLKRLEKSAILSRMSLPSSLEHYKSEIEKTFLKFDELQSGNSKQDVYARIIISRGAGQIGFSLKSIHTPPSMTIIMQPVDAPTAESFQKGAKLQIVNRLRNDRRALDPAMKSGNYLNSILAFLEAEENGFLDALLCNAEGHITEGTTFNIFYIRRGILVTPPLEIGILEGITRKKVIQLARELNIPFREVRFPRERLYEADEVFLTGSVKEVFPVVQVDHQVISKNSPGPLTRSIHSAYHKAIQSFLKSHSVTSNRFPFSSPTPGGIL